MTTIQRYKIGYRSDEWGQRSSTPSGIPDHAGPWVRYEDHAAALVAAQQSAPSTVSDDLRDTLVAVSAAIAERDDRAAQKMIREILVASPTPPAEQQAAPKAAPRETSNWPETCDGKEQEAWEAWASRNRYDMRQHPLHYLFLHSETDAARQGWKAGLQYAVDQMRKATPQQDAQEPVGEVQHLHELNDSWLNKLPIGTKLYTAHQPAPAVDAMRAALLRCIAAIERTSHCTEADRLAAADEARAAINADRADRTPADSVTAPAGWKLVPVEPTADQEWAGKTVLLGDITMGEACKIYKAMLSASPTPKAAGSVTAPIGLEDAARLEALHAAVTAIYLDDSSDFKSALGAVVRHLDPNLAGDLLAWPKRAYDISQARLDAARKQGADRHVAS